MWSQLLHKFNYDISSQNNKLHKQKDIYIKYTVCPGSSDPPEKKYNIFESENEVYTIYLLLRYFRVNIIRLQSKLILGQMNSIG